MARRLLSSQMLRSALIAIGVLCLVGGIFAMVLSRAAPGLLFAIWGVILLLGTLYERVRYKALLRAGPTAAVRTTERFIDNDTGKTVTVYVDPGSGERSYVEE
jgi:hypothetical protein